jgi:polyhydroxyalkanoate synthase subunit PhaC
LLAAQVDFEEAGELTLFIDESQIEMIDAMMNEQGYLDAQQMAGAFQMIRSNDLVWSRVIHNYLMGERRPVIDLMAWNGDTTRMPYRMQSEYLRRFFLDNDLAEGRYDFDGRPVALGDVDLPVFAVATQTDHVAPWKSVYKINGLINGNLTFLLASGGHNAGIVPDLRRVTPHYQVATRLEHTQYIDPETWQTNTPVQSGSWWLPWSQWLGAQSGNMTEPPAMGAPKAGFAPLIDAPGSYVRRK